VSRQWLFDLETLQLAREISVLLAAHDVGTEET
jgi:hypothetical protein